MLLDLGAYPVSYLHSFVDSRLWQDNYELVTAIAHDAVRVTNGRQDHRSNFHQRVRAHQMSVQIVDSLEIIQIEKHRRDGCLVTPGALDLVDQKLAQVTRVVQLGQIVCQ